MLYIIEQRIENRKEVIELVFAVKLEIILDLFFELV